MNKRLCDLLREGSEPGGWLEQAVSELGAAIAQTVPSDDQIIMEHVRRAHQHLARAYDQVLHETLTAPAAEEPCVSPSGKAYIWDLQRRMDYSRDDTNALIGLLILELAYLRNDLNSAVGRTGKP